MKLRVSGERHGTLRPRRRRDDVREQEAVGRGGYLEGEVVVQTMPGVSVIAEPFPRSEGRSVPSRLFHPKTSATAHTTPQSEELVGTLSVVICCYILYGLYYTGHFGKCQMSALVENDV